MSGHVLRNVRSEPAAPLPIEIMRGVRAVGDIDRVNAACLLLPDALEQPLRAGAFHAHRNAGIFRLEQLAEPFRDRQLQGRVERKLALLARSLAQSRRDRARPGASEPDAVR